MMKKINEYIYNHEIPYLTENIPDLYKQLEEIRKIRNNAAHGNDVSFEDFQIVKNFLFSEQALAYISWAKIYYEENEK
ncbi:hypothetical protein ACIQGW_03820 [Lysinibacillus xylanilyticus]|uniref:hypothetical protein n=1 Tax=Lysinibacillus xylanilyticus TaxID=582475 RepID=UPI0037F47ED9